MIPYPIYNYGMQTSKADDEDILLKPSLICSIIHTIFSLICLFLDISIFALLFQSGAYIIFSLLVLVMICKYSSQVVWFIILFTKTVNTSTKQAYIIIVSVGLGVIAITLLILSLYIYGAFKNFIQLMIHPNFIEGLTYVIAATLVLIFTTRKKPVNNGRSNFYYYPVNSQMQSYPTVYRYPQIPYI